MLGDVGNYWQILIGMVLVWVALGMLGVEKCSMSGSLLYRLNLRGPFGAFGLGLAYGILSGSCTFGFIAPILAIITVHPREIAVNALKDEQEADKILEWLKREINEAWEKRAEIKPRYEGAPKPKIFEILKLLPKTNCRECGQPTCMVFAVEIAEGAKGPEDCPALEEEERLKLANYMGQFQLDI